MNLFDILGPIIGGAVVLAIVVIVEVGRRRAHYHLDVDLTIHDEPAPPEHTDEP